MWMRGAVQDTARDTLPTFRQLEDPRYFPYRYGQALLAYVGGTLRRRPDRRAAARRRPDAGRGPGDSGGAEPHARPAGGPLARRHPRRRTTRCGAGPSCRIAYGPKLVGVNGEDVGQYNLAPALSPDGNQMMFFSDRGLFSIDLYLADARTGKVKRQITRTAVDPHLESLQFIQSAGSWSGDGKRFVFAGIDGGRPDLNIYDVDARTHRARDPAPAAGRDPQPELVAGRAADRLLRAGRRPDRPVRLRPRGRHARTA